jgi:hypothetical protein
MANKLVTGLLRSPMHGLLSDRLDVVRYTGRRSGRTFATPTQYVVHGDELIILVGRPETKAWWRNFRTDHDLDVLLRGRWTAMTGRAVVGAEEPEVVGPLLDAYLARFPKAMRALGQHREDRVRRAVVVRCRPR